MSTEELKSGIEERLERLSEKGEDVADYLWDLLTKYDKSDEMEDNDDEKKEKDKNKKSKSEISTIVDWKNTVGGMCHRGHSMQACTRTVGGKDEICNGCGSSDDIRGCVPCSKIYSSGKQHLWCRKCVVNNVDKVQIEWQRNENKRKIIRKVLYANPELSDDLLSGLPRAAALHKTLNEIVTLTPLARNNYCMYLIDLDNFKALNSALGHDGADKVVVDIANIFKKYQKQIINGQWNNKKNGEIQRMFIYRQGGDEFALILQCGSSFQQRQRIFYESWKKEINGLGDKYLKNINNVNEEKANETFKEREKKKIFTALEGLEISNDIKDVINKAIEKKEFNVALDKIGISVGMYCANTHPLVQLKQTSSDWLNGAEKAQEQVKQLVGKNDIRIFNVTGARNRKEKVLDGNSFWKDG